MNLPALDLLRALEAPGRIPPRGPDSLWWAPAVPEWGEYNMVRVGFFNRN